MLLLKVTIVILVFFCYNQSISALILDKCEAAKELANAGVPRTFISNFVCLMQSESNFNTSKKTGPGHKASYSYGIFQISSDEWCNAWRPGGHCGRTCSDFLSGNVKEDIACAKTIWEMRGFKHWKSWEKNCKNKKLPDVSQCFSGAKEYNNDGSIFDQQKDQLFYDLGMPDWENFGSNSQVLRLPFSLFEGFVHSFL